MTVTSMAPTFPMDPPSMEVPVRQVVAVVLENHGSIALLKRSWTVGHDRGLWHCVTGYLDPGVSPQQQALLELREETGLSVMDLSSLRRCASLSLPDGQGDNWDIHTFKTTTITRKLRMNEEHTAYRWVKPLEAAQTVGRVQWLTNVLEATLR